MPRKTKEQKELENENKIEKTAKKVTPKKEVTSKKATSTPKKASKTKKSTTKASSTNKSKTTTTKKKTATSTANKKNTAKNRVIIKRQRASSTILLLESCLSSQKSMEIDILLKDRQGRTRHYFCGPLSYSIYKTICKKNYISTNMDWVKCLNDTFSQIMYRRGKQQLVIEYTE